jgi:ribokinase
MTNTARPLMFFGTTNLDFCFSVSHLPCAGESVMGSLSQYAGGKGANQAVAAAKLGFETHFYSRLGDDESGKFLLRALKDAGVKSDAIEIASGERSGSALVAVDALGRNQIIIDPGANRHISVESIQRGASLIPDDAVVVAEMGLSLPALEHLFSLKSEHSFTLIFNPAPVQAGLSHDAWSAVDVVTPNAVEACELTGIDVKDRRTAELAANALLELGPRAALITMGEQGAYYADAQQRFEVPAFAVRAIDTTGAGDAFNGAFAAGVASRLPMRTAIRRAMATAAISVTRCGAQIAMPTLKELEEFLHSTMSLEV